AERSNSERSVSVITTPVPVVGSYDLITPCTEGSLPQTSLRDETCGLVTLPALMHDVRTLTRLGAPFTSARMRWMFGFQRRLVRRWVWLTDMPHEGCLPHTSHTAAMAGNLLDGQFGSMNATSEVGSFTLVGDTP